MKVLLAKEGGGGVLAESNNGINRLARTIDSRMRRQTDMPSVLDFGTIKKNGSLVTNTFPKAIAKGDYSVLDGLEQDEQDTKVLVAWVEDEAVVVGAW